MPRLGLAALGAALGFYAIGLAIWEPGTLTLPTPVHVAIGWSFVAAGLVAWQQRPENRLGLLMTLTGVVWFGRDFDWFGSWTANHASELSQNFFLALLAHQIVVFPYGVTRSRLDRAVVVAAYALALGAYPPSEVSDEANTAFSALAIVLAPVIVYVIVDRWLRASRRNGARCNRSFSSGRRCSSSSPSRSRTTTSASRFRVPVSPSWTGVHSPTWRYRSRSWSVFCGRVCGARSWLDS